MATIRQAAPVFAGRGSVVNYRAPVWSGAPLSLTNQSPGAQIPFAGYVTDPDGNAITFSLASGGTNGYSITAAGVLTIGTVSQSVTIRARDDSAALLAADWVVAVAVTVVDTTAPTVPIGLAAYVSATNTVTVSWSASSDASPPITYLLRRSIDQSNWTSLSPDTATSYVDSGLVSLQTYYYQVAARDAVGNTSAYSASCAVTVQAAGSWQLASGHYIASKMTAEVIHPRPATESDVYERHRRAPSGIQWRCPVVVQGGSWPFKYELTTGPSDMTIGETLPTDWLTNGLQNYGVLTWDNPTVGSHPITVTVRGQDGTTATRTWTLEVISRENTAYFLFVNASAAAGGNGSYSAPFRTIADWYTTNRSDATYLYRQCFYYTGTYTFPPEALQSPNKWDFKGVKPQVHVALPGQTVTWDLQDTGMIDHNGGGSGFCYSGIRFTNWRQYGNIIGTGNVYRNSAIRFNTDASRSLIFENTFVGGGSSRYSMDRTNSSPVMYTSSSGSWRSTYHAHVKNTYDGCWDTDTVLCYDTWYLVFEGNRFVNGYGHTNNGGWGVYLKGVNYAEGLHHYTIRANVGIDGTISRPILRSDYTGATSYVEVCWNSWRNNVAAPTTYAKSYLSAGNENSGLQSNFGPHWFYRNSARMFNLIPVNIGSGPWTFENEAWQHDGTYPGGFTSVNCTVPFTRTNMLAATSGLLNATTNLLEPAYAANLGTHGCEVA